MRILLTGANGFLGAYLQRELQSRGDLFRLGRTSPAEVFADFSKEIPAIPEVDLVVHAAGVAHFLPKTAEEEAQFHTVNVQGTEKLLRRLSENSLAPKSFVFISSVAVYGQETGKLINEDSPLLGSTPYAVSKILAEQLILDWGEKQGVSTYILRLPLIVGEHAPGNLGAMQKAIRSGYYFRIGKGDSRKSMVLAEDVAALVSRLTGGGGGIYNLTDNVDPKLAELDTVMALRINKSVKVIPLALIKPLAMIGDRFSFFPINTYRLKKLRDELTFDCSKAKRELNWEPKSVLSWLSK